MWPVGFWPGPCTTAAAHASTAYDASGNPTAAPVILDGEGAATAGDGVLASGTRYPLSDYTLKSGITLPAAEYVLPASSGAPATWGYTGNTLGPGTASGGGGLTDDQAAQLAALYAALPADNATIGTSNFNPTAAGVQLAASQPNYAPAKAGDAMTLTSAYNAAKAAASQESVDAGFEAVETAALLAASAAVGNASVDQTDPDNPVVTFAAPGTSTPVAKVTVPASGNGQRTNSTVL